jgi:hypothetical protein
VLINLPKTVRQWALCTIYAPWVIPCEVGMQISLFLRLEPSPAALWIRIKKYIYAQALKFSRYCRQ